MNKEEFKKIQEQCPITCPQCRERWFALFDRVYIAKYGICFMCDDTIGEELDISSFDQKTKEVTEIIKKFS